MASEENTTQTLQNKIDKVSRMAKGSLLFLVPICLSAFEWQTEGMWHPTRMGAQLHDHAAYTAVTRATRKIHEPCSMLYY